MASDLVPSHQIEGMLAESALSGGEGGSRRRVEIVASEEWYGDSWDADAILRRWEERERLAASEGYAGLRVVENPSCRGEAAWRTFLEYEARLNDVFAGRRIVGLCSHRIDRCTASQVIDVLRNHHYTLVKGNGAWEVLESPARRGRPGPAKAPSGEEDVEGLEERIAALEANLSARDGFLNLAAHELKTPITALQLYVDGLLRTLHKRVLSGEEVESRLQKVREQSVRLDRLVSSLLDVSRVSTKQMSLYPEEVDLTELSLTVIERFREEATRAVCPLDFRTGGPVFGRWDRARLEQLLGNLLSNAIKYAPGRVIRVSVMQDGPMARLSVIDQGPGVPEADRARIFERFTRLGKGTYQSGFGLGLWVGRQIVQAHGGTLSVSGDPGEGATFTAVLPRRREEEPA